MEKFEEGFRKALADAGDTHSLEDVKTMLAQHRAGGIISVDGQAAVIFRAIDAPRKSILFLWLATGDLDSVCDLVDEICEGARGSFDKAVFIGRRGWQRTPLIDQGWEPTRIQYEREL